MPNLGLKFYYISSAYIIEKNIQYIYSMQYFIIDE